MMEDEMIEWREKLNDRIRRRDVIFFLNGLMSGTAFGCFLGIVLASL